MTLKVVVFAGFAVYDPESADCFNQAVSPFPPEKKHLLALVETHSTTDNCPVVTDAGKATTLMLGAEAKDVLTSNPCTPSADAPPLVKKNTLTKNNTLILIIPPELLFGEQKRFPASRG